MGIAPASARAGDLCRALDQVRLGNRHPPRLALAAGLIALGARRNRPAIVPVAAMLALPGVWVNSLAMLVAVDPLWRRPERFPKGKTETSLQPVATAGGERAPDPMAEGTSADLNSRSSIRK